MNKRDYKLKKYEPIQKKDGTYSRWKFIKELPSAQKRRYILAECECGQISKVDLYGIYSGKTNGCPACRIKKSKVGHRKDSDRWHSNRIGKCNAFFHNIYKRNKDKYKQYKRIGKGSLSDGYIILTDIENRMKTVLDSIKTEDDIDRINDCIQQFIGE